ncbi:MAG: hypothetical protein ACP5IZ_08715 [Thermoprotei archaeon]
MVYIVSTLSTLYFHFNILLFNKTLSFLIFLGIFSIMLWIAECYFFIMATTKYFELKRLENKLGISKIYEELSKSWNYFSKILHWLYYQASGIKYEQWKRLSIFIDILTLIWIILTGYITVLIQQVQSSKMNLKI